MGGEHRSRVCQSVYSLDQTSRSFCFQGAGWQEERRRAAGEMTQVALRPMGDKPLSPSHMIIATYCIVHPYKSATMMLCRDKVLMNYDLV